MVISPHRRWLAGCTTSAERAERVASGAEPAACGSTEPRPRQALRRVARRQGGAPRGRPEDGWVVVGPWARLRGRAMATSAAPREQRGARSSGGSGGDAGGAPSSQPSGVPQLGQSMVNAPSVWAAFGVWSSPRGAPHRGGPRGEAFQRRTPNRRGAFDRQRSIYHGSTDVQYVQKQ